MLLSKSTLQLHVKDKQGRTALHLAAVNGHRELMSQLIGQGADINAKDEVLGLEACQLEFQVYPLLPSPPHSSPPLQFEPVLQLFYL